MTGTDISPPDPAPAQQPFDWRLFAAGLVFLIVAAGSALPFMYTLQTITEGKSSPPILAPFGGQVLLEGTAALALGLYLGGMPYPKIPVIMARIVVQNTALGLVLGWLYRRWGLESAMLAHFLVDAVLYVVLVPSLQSQNAPWALAALASLVIALTWALQGLRKRARRHTRRSCPHRAVGAITQL